MTPRSSWNSYFSSRSAYHSTICTGVSSCGPSVRRSGAPTSATSSGRSSSRCVTSAPWSWRKHLTRNSTSCDQSVVSKARRALVTARAASSTDASAAVPSDSPVDGLIVGYVRSPSAATSSPSMSRRSSCHMSRKLSSPKSVINCYEGAPGVPCDMPEATSVGGTVRDRAASELRDRILTVRLRPGTRVDLDAITAEFRTSRTPVREALLELSYEGLVAIAPRSGITVLGITPDDAVDNFAVLAALVGKAAEWATARITAQQLADLRDLADAIRFTDDLVEANRRFHR